MNRGIIFTTSLVIILLLAVITVFYGIFIAALFMFAFYPGFYVVYRVYTRVKQTKGSQLVGGIQHGFDLNGKETTKRRR